MSYFVVSHRDPVYVVASSPTRSCIDVYFIGDNDDTDGDFDIDDDTDRDFDDNDIDGYVDDIDDDVAGALAHDPAEDR